MTLKERIKRLLKVDPRIVRRLRKIISPIRRIGLKKEFTILADNCWGGRVYDKLGLQYLTPTIGLGIEVNDFIKFLKNYDYYFTLKPKPIENEQKKVNDEWGFYDCTLGDIKILFRHYRNSNDAIEKWERRKQRIKKDNIIVKMSYYQKEIDYDLLNEFFNLPFKKILFVCHKELLDYGKNYNCKTIYIPEEQTNEEFTIADKKLKLKEIKKIINL